MKEDLVKEIEFEGVTAQLNDGVLTIKGTEEVIRDFTNPKVNISIEGNKVVLKVSKASKRERAVIGSYSAHIKNMIKGAKEPFLYKLKICSGHFPMNVGMSGDDFIIKNFLGEAVPRKVKIMVGAKVKISGTEITVTAANKEVAGQMAARIETLCRITNRDKRIFQDGIYIIHKAGKDI